jgi:hypothetical protein
MFHLTHGLFFEKLDGGWVRLTKRETPDPKSPMQFQVTMDKNAWASIVKAMADDQEPKPEPEPQPVSETQEAQTSQENQENQEGQENEPG